LACNKTEQSSKCRKGVDGSRWDGRRPAGISPKQSLSCGEDSEGRQPRQMRPRGKTSTVNACHRAPVSRHKVLQRTSGIPKVRTRYINESTRKNAQRRCARQAVFGSIWFMMVPFLFAIQAPSVVPSLHNAKWRWKTAQKSSPFR